MARCLISFHESGMAAHRGGGGRKNKPLEGGRQTEFTDRKSAPAGSGESEAGGVACNTFFPGITREPFTSLGSKMVGPAGFEPATS